MTIAPLTWGLLDTSVVLAYREGWPAPVQFFTELRTIGLPEFSQITGLVLYSQCRDANDILAVETFPQVATVRTITANIARRAQLVLRSLPQPSALSADDAIVAATAIEHKLPLSTLDPPKFAGNAGLVTIKPY